MRHSLISLLAFLLVAPAAHAEVQQLDNGALQRAIAEGRATVVDIRREDEWLQTGIIEGSHLLTFFDGEGKYDADAWLGQLREVVGPTEPVILICRTGNRTRAVSDFLDQQAGQAQVYNVTSGITKWISEGNPVVSPSGR